MQRWSKRINYMDEVKVEGLGTKLYLVCEFLVAISSYSFRITVLFLQYCHQAQLLLSKIYHNCYITTLLFLDGSLVFHETTMGVRCSSHCMTIWVTSGPQKYNLYKVDLLLWWYILRCYVIMITWDAKQDVCVADAVKGGKLVQCLFCNLVNVR